MSESSSSQKEAQSPSMKPVTPKTDFWVAVIQCMEGKPKIDFEKLAELCGYKNASSASVTYNTRRKAALKDFAAAPLRVADSPIAKPKRGRKPKTERDGEPPKKRGKGRPPKIKEPEVAKSEEAEAEAETETELEWDEETEPYTY